jgi:Fic family protein
MVGENLGENFQAVPGKFRDHPVVVGTYRAPDAQLVKEMTRQFCDWMKDHFHYEKGQNFIDAVIQAIVSHIYIAWIHPFGDGNGRTARLLEFYILLRAGNPDFALHLLSNFYNQTRPEYYRHLDKSSKTGDLTEFIAYAVRGYRDGLFEILEIIQKNQMDISWKNHIYNIFDSKKVTAKYAMLNKRRRNLILSIPPYQYFKVDDLIKINIDTALEYKDLSIRTINRDINELTTLELLAVDSKGLYYANYDLLKQYIPRKINRK